MKSQQSLKLRILDYVFFTFFKNAASKNVVAFIWIFKKRNKRILELCCTDAHCPNPLGSTSV